MPLLDEELSDQINELCDLGIDLAEGGRFDKALEAFDMAWDLLPDPKTEWEESFWILGNKGDAYFQQRDYAAGREVLERAMRCLDAVGEGFLHLRLGQCLFELGEMEQARRELALALEREADTIFIDEDPKYLSLVMESGGGENQGIAPEFEDS